MIVFCFLNRSDAENINTYKVMKIIDGRVLYIDFNNDNKLQSNEKDSIDGIKTFCAPDDTELQQRYKLTDKEVLGLCYEGKEFAKDKLLFQQVTVNRIGNSVVSISYDNGKDFAKEILKAGFAVVDESSPRAEELKEYEQPAKIKNNAKKAGKYNLVLVNKTGRKYHKCDCQYGLKSSRAELIMKTLSFNFEPAGCCYKQKAQKKLPTDIEKPVPDIHTKKVDVYFIDPTKYSRPADYARTAAAQRLLGDLKNANSIEFAIYGIGGQPEIFDAIVDAKKAGKLVRGVTDMDKNHKNEYNDTVKLIEALGEDILKTDFYFTKVAEDARSKYLLENWETISANEYKGYTQRVQYHLGDKEIDMSLKSKEILLVQKGIMHNKVFIIDKKIVWTGSTNVSSAGYGGYNANVAVRIDDGKVANLFLQELDQMHTKEKFHEHKEVIPDNENLKIDEETIMSVFFLPKHDPIEKSIRPLLQQAKRRIYVPMFYLTHAGIIQDLLDAKARNIDVIVILDASGAQNLYAKHSILRQAEIPVYVENWGGKMHMKSAIIDDVYICGSMNWTKAGSTNNDENVVVIYNKKIADGAAKNFMYLKNSIPEKCLRKDILPESWESINSCYDGMDNDHDGLTDEDSEFCRPRKNYK